MQENPDSMISKIYGIHKVIFSKGKGKRSKKIWFCVMGNVFQTRFQVDVRYDLKGSLWGR